MQSAVLYISGPYSGDVYANIAAARAVATELWNRGYPTICPHLNTAHFENDCDAKYDDYIEGDCTILERCDGLVMLPNWEQSAGAKAEKLHAEARGIPVGIWPDVPTFKKETILQEADRLTEGDRNRDYGHPLDDFTRQAHLYTGVLMDLLRPGISIPWSRIPLLMNCTKIAREVNHPKRDNRVDGPGYWKTLDMGHAEQKRRRLEQMTKNPS